MNARRVLVVSNRLPVSVERKEGRWHTQRTVGGLASALSAVAAYTDLQWIGWPGLTTTDPVAQAAVAEQLGRELNCRPVFIPSTLFDKYYHGFSNSCLWPLFHYFPRTARYEAAAWEAYRAVNELFAERVAANARPGDCIWIHDYHLLLLPALLRQRLPEAALGFFLHIPFPSYELFRELPWREALLRGLLGADLVGFHTYDYTRHFLNSLLRGLGLEQDFGQVTVEGRTVRADTFPLGVDTVALAQAAAAPKPRSRRQGDYRLILSVDRLDFTKGIPQRLLAFDRFLERYREWRERVRLLLICVPSRERVTAYKELKRQVDELVGLVNGKYSTPNWTPIQYLYRSFDVTELAGFYRQAHVALVTPLRDGMNLVAKEYLASRPDESGVLVLSETAGAAAELGEALMVNANDLDGMAAALARALAMPPAEQAERNRAMRARLRRYDVRRWADDFLGRLEEAHAGQQQQRRRRLDGAWRDELRTAYRASRRRLLLLDYDGTLVPLAPTPAQAAPPPALLQLLQRLGAVPANRVVVISGRDNATLERWLHAPGVVLVAEHGAWVMESEASGWQRTGDRLGASLAPEWKDRIRPVLETFVDRTPGALLEEKALALAWHYRNADPELGTLRAKELVDTLGSLLANSGLQVLRGSKVLEVKQSGIGKGQAALAWLNGEAAPDFVLALGDDETDELMFEALPATAWTVRVGHQRRTHARFYVDHPAAVRELLAQLAEEDSPQA